jgi:AcrR family transcriptional regulator
MHPSKEHIITVASLLFLQKSYKEVTMQEIVKNTGLSKGAFYHYFKSKEQLFLEVLDFFFSTVFVHDYDAYSKDSFYQFYHDYARATKKIGKKYLEKFRDSGNDVFNINYFSMVIEGTRLFPGFRENMVRGFQHELETWKGVIRKARKNKEIKTEMTDEEIAKTFIGLGDGISMHMLMRGASIQEITGEFITLWDKLYDEIKA